MTVASSSEWTTALEGCRTQDWAGASAGFTAAIAAHGPGRALLIARALCRVMEGNESGAIVDLCAASDMSESETDAPAQAELAEVCGESAVAKVTRLIKREVPDSDIKFRPATSPVKAGGTAASSTSLADKWQQEHATVLKLVQSRSWREAERTAQAFLAQVERTVPGRRINAVELSALQADVEAALMAIHCDHSADLLKHDNPALALIFARRASGLLGPHQDSSHVVVVRVTAAKAAIALPIVEQALDELEEASRHVRTREERAEVGQLLAQLGDVARDQRVWILATSAYRLAAAMYRQSEPGDDSARALALMLEAAATKISELAATS